MTPRLKAGDSFILTKEISDAKRNTYNSSDVSSRIGKPIHIENIRNDGSNGLTHYVDDQTYWYEADMVDKLLNKSLTPLNMSIVDAIKNLARKEPAKTYVKLGVTDADGTLTEEGQSAFLQHQFELNAGDKSPFFEQCKAVLEEQEKKEK